MNVEPEMEPHVDTVVLDREVKQSKSPSKDTEGTSNSNRSSKSRAENINCVEMIDKESLGKKEKARLFEKFKDLESMSGTTKRRRRIKMAGNILINVQLKSSMIPPLNHQLNFPL